MGRDRTDEYKSVWDMTKEVKTEENMTWIRRQKDRREDKQRQKKMERKRKGQVKRGKTNHKGTGQMKTQRRSI